MNILQTQLSVQAELMSTLNPKCFKMNLRNRIMIRWQIFVYELFKAKGV